MGREDRILVVHISKERYDNLRAQGYKLLDRSSGEWRSIIKRLGGGDTLYHLLDGDEAECSECFRLRTSIKAETPADLETLKYKFRYGPFPTIIIDRNGLEMDLQALSWINKQVELLQVMGDYAHFNLSIQRLPVEPYLGSHTPSVITMPE